MLCRVPASAIACAFASLLGLAALSASAPRPAHADEAPVALGWKLRPGAHLVYEVVSDQQATQTIDGRSYETRQKLTVVYGLSVQDRDAEGSARLTCRYERVAIELDQLQLGKVAWDSDKAEDESRAEEPSVRPFAALVKRSFSFVMTADGRVPAEGFHGYDKVRESVLAPIADQPLVRAAYEPAFSDAAMRAALERAWRVLPDDPVAVGARWERQAVQPIPLLGPLRFDSRFHLAAIEGEGDARVARIGIEVALAREPAPPGVAGAEPPAHPIAVAFEGGSGAGEAIFSLADGWLVRSVCDTRMTLSSRIAEEHAPASGPGARSARSEVRQRLTVARKASP